MVAIVTALLLGGVLIPPDPEPLTMEQLTGSAQPQPQPSAASAPPPAAAASVTAAVNTGSSPGGLGYLWIGGGVAVAGLALFGLSSWRRAHSAKS